METFPLSGSYRHMQESLEKILSFSWLARPSGPEMYTTVTNCADDVLLRQKLWAEDINVGSGVLDMLDAIDSQSSSVIRLYFMDICNAVEDIRTNMESIPPK